MNTHTFNLVVKVLDEQVLYDSAKKHAIEVDGLLDIGSEITDLIGTRDVPFVSACLQMLFDPGTSPAGCEIEESYVC